MFSLPQTPPLGLHILTPSPSQPHLFLQQYSSSLNTPPSPCSDSLNPPTLHPSSPSPSSPLLLHVLTPSNPSSPSPCSDSQPPSLTCSCLKPPSLLHVLIPSTLPPSPPSPTALILPKTLPFFSMFWLPQTSLPALLHQ